jgi:hypothetical protein
VAESGATGYLYFQDQPILSLKEFDSYVYGLPEDAVSPITLSRWAFGEPIELSELLDCLRNDAVVAAGDSDESLQIVRLALERLEALFPDELT